MYFIQIKRLYLFFRFFTMGDTLYRSSLYLSLDWSVAMGVDIIDKQVYAFGREDQIVDPFC